MENAFGEEIEPSSSDDVSSAYDLVAQGQADATVQDNPAAAYYVRKDADRLKNVGEGRVANFYVALTAARDKELRDKIDAALRKGIKDGTLERIYRKYGLWNDDQERLAHWAQQPWPPGAADEQQGPDTAGNPIDWNRALRLLGDGAAVTVLLALTSFPIAVLVGLAVAVARTYGPAWAAILGRIYVEVLRGTPLLLQLWFIYYLLPRLTGVEYDPFWAGVIGLALNYSANEAENFRAGFQAVPPGQTEAALALGMTPARGRPPGRAAAGGAGRDSRR